jgi:hypothetical protein
LDGFQPNQVVQLTKTESSIPCQQKPEGEVRAKPVRKWCLFWPCPASNAI